MRLIDADNLEECKEIMTTISGESKYAVRMDDIRNMPTITIPVAELDTTNEERPHGEWIHHKYDKDFECSVCRHRFDEDELGLEIPQYNATWIKVCFYNFCPCCGSDNRPREGEAE